MQSLTYRKLLTADDPDVPRLSAVYHTPEVAQFIHLSDSFFLYVTGSRDVHFYKVYRGDTLVAALHLELQDAVLSMAVMVFPGCRRAGLGTRIVKDAQDDVFGLGHERIEVAVETENAASLRLFGKTGFVPAGEEDGLITLVWQR